MKTVKYKLLLYCNKSKPYLVYHREYCSLSPTEYIEYGYETRWEDKSMLEDVCNGNIVAECDYEVEKIKYDWYPNNIIPEGDHYYTYYRTDKIEPKELYEKSCLSWEQLNSYLNDYDLQSFDGGYAIHIKNLHIFDIDDRKELNEFLYEDDTDGHYGVWTVERAPKNGTVICTDFKDIGGVYCCRGTYGRFLALSPYELRDILNGKKTVVIRKSTWKEW